MSDDAKKTILARRASFMAAAIASVGIACGKTQSSPEPCLSVSVPMNYDQDAEQPQPPPRPCLSPVRPDVVDAGPDDSGTGTGTGTGTGGRRDGGVAQPIPVEPIPLPCLSVLKPRGKEPRKQ